MLRCFFVFGMKKKKGLKIHKMTDWKSYRLEIYSRLLQGGQNDFQKREIAYRVQDNNWGIYETLKVYEDGVAYNDGSWLIYNTGRMRKYDDKVLYKDKVFCCDKNHVIDVLYSYILFLRKIGIEVVYEMNYYAVAFLTKYLRFYDKVFDCTMENKKKVGELCQAAFNKAPEDIDCNTRIDPRKFALDPGMTERMTRGMNRSQATAVITRVQKKVQKQMKDELIEKWYNPRLSERDNIKWFRDNGIEDVSLPRLHQWIKEYIKDKGVRYGFQN